MTIYEIKQRTLKTSPYFFSRSTMRFFGQTMRNFSVKKMADGRYKVSAPIIDQGRKVGETMRYFNPETNDLENS